MPQFLRKILKELSKNYFVRNSILRGIPKIIDTYGKEAIEFRENAIVVKIPFNWINVVGNKVGNKVGNRKDKGLTNNRQLILQEIRNNPNITTVQLSKV